MGGSHRREASPPPPPARSPRPRLCDAHILATPVSRARRRSSDCLRDRGQEAAFLERGSVSYDRVWVSQMDQFVKIIRLRFVHLSVFNSIPPKKNCKNTMMVRIEWGLERGWGSVKQEQWDVGDHRTGKCGLEGAMCSRSACLCRSRREAVMCPVALTPCSVLITAGSWWGVRHRPGRYPEGGAAACTCVDGRAKGGILPGRQGSPEHRELWAHVICTPPQNWASSPRSIHRDSVDAGRHRTLRPCCVGAEVYACSLPRTDGILEVPFPQLPCSAVQTERKLANRRRAPRGNPEFRGWGVGLQFRSAVH